MCTAIALAAAMTATAPPPMDAAAAAQRAAVIERRFAMMDRNRDGFLAENEAPRSSRARCGGDSSETAAASWVADFDGNGDGRVDREEFVAGSIPNAPLQTAARPDVAR